jgi:hypothetical protein
LCSSQKDFSRISQDRDWTLERGQQWHRHRKHRQWLVSRLKFPIVQLFLSILQSYRDVDADVCVIRIWWIEKEENNIFNQQQSTRVWSSCPRRSLTVRSTRCKIPYSLRQLSGTLDKPFSNYYCICSLVYYHPQNSSSSRICMTFDKFFSQAWQMSKNNIDREPGHRSKK